MPSEIAKLTEEAEIAQASYEVLHVLEIVYRRPAPDLPQAGKIRRD
jgi:hypothetical protein